MPPPFNPILFFSEPIYTIVAIVFCILIYYKTKESYDLTKYRGIQYFRNAFLFFGLSYLARFIFSLAFFSLIALDIFIPRRMFMPFLILPLGYLSTVAIMYLISCTIWKKFKNVPLAFISHSIAIIIALIGFFSRSHRMLLYLQSALLLVALSLSIISHRIDKKSRQIHTIYILVSVLWLINLWIIERMRMLFFIDIFFEVVSVIVLMIIYKKISKWMR